MREFNNYVAICEIDGKPAYFLDDDHKLIDDNNQIHYNDGLKDIVKNVIVYGIIKCEYKSTFLGIGLDLLMYTLKIDGVCEWQIKQSYKKGKQAKYFVDFVHVEMPRMGWAGSDGTDQYHLTTTRTQKQGVNII